MRTGLGTIPPEGLVMGMTTTGRRTGVPRRIEIRVHDVHGRVVISGSPRADRRRAWLLNLASEPRLTFHPGKDESDDVAATARVITDEAERREVAAWIQGRAWPGYDLEAMIADSPMAEVTFDG